MTWIANESSVLGEEGAGLEGKTENQPILKIRKELKKDLIGQVNRYEKNNKKCKWK